MGKIYDFLERKCNNCRYHNSDGTCSNKKYIKNMREVLMKGWCPYYKKIGVDSIEDYSNVKH